MNDREGGLKGIDDALAQSEAIQPKLSVARQGRWPAPMRAAAFHGILGDIVRKIEPETEADPAAVLIQLLVSFGNLIGCGPYFLVDGHKHYTNMFAIMVGSTSKGRKGTSWARVRSVLERIDEGWTSDQVVSGMSSGEGLVFQVRDPIETKKRNKNGEIETEAIDLGVEDKRLLVQESEFASVLQVMSRSGNTLSPIVRDAWDQGNLRFLTKNTPLKATDAHISISAHITDEELKRYLDRTETANGFANRFLFVCVKRSQCLPDGGREIDWGDTTERLGAIAERAKQVGRMRRTQSASRLWHEVYPKLSGGRPGLMGAVTGRAEAQVLRLSMIYALADDSDVIDLEHLEAALEVWRYCDVSACYVFGDKQGDPVADKILLALQMSPDGLTQTDLSHHFNRHLKSSDLNRALELLASRQLIGWGDVKTDGRTARTWFAK